MWIGEQRGMCTVIMSKTIHIDATLQSDLDWAKARDEAQEADLILWSIDLGLISCLNHPLENEMQFRSLCLSLQHFRETLLAEFEDKTEGVCLYRGSPDFREGFLWDENQVQNLQEWIEQYFLREEKLSNEIGISTFTEISHDNLEKTFAGRRLLSLFCRDAVAEYLELLGSALPESLQLVLEFSSVDDPMMMAELTSRDCFRNFDVRESFTSPTATVGICLPPTYRCHPSHLSLLRPVVENWVQDKIPFRVIPESDLTMEWHGLDELVVASSAMSGRGNRMLQGFEAAGGKVTLLA